MTAVACIKKKNTIKIGEFLHSHFNIECGLSGFVLEILCSLDDTPQLGRLVEVDSDQIKTSIENNVTPGRR